MDSLTQIALGAAVGVAVMRRRTAVWKAALWGAIGGTLPDLDVFIDHGDPILNMVLHRAQSHALFWLTLFSLPFTAIVVWLHREAQQWRRWWLALWLVLITHPLLDALTVYGTQLALPFSSHPFAVGSVFIIDPLVTLPWLAGPIWALAARGSARSLRANDVTLLLGCAYLALGLVAQQQVRATALSSLQQQGVRAERLLVTPAAFSVLLWRVVAIDGGRYLEGYRSLLDAPGPMHFDRFDRGAALDADLAAHPGAARIRAFSHGFYKFDEVGTLVRISDLRMGAEPNYSFSFAIARRASAVQALPTTRSMGSRIDLQRALPWFWRRLRGEALPPPR
ncbi:MAG: metal-dependent hydrolase [Burkholderiales bacterium]|nr:metal-dependent hydrolase [Burkholderiales bacterium]